MIVVCKVCSMAIKANAFAHHLGNASVLLYPFTLPGSQSYATTASRVE